MGDKLSEKAIEQRQKAALKHGGSGAETRLTKGREFVGVARETEIAVTQELESDGLAGVYRKRALRLQTVSDLYYQAILGAENIDDLDKFVKRYGWLQASALRSLVMLKELEKDQDQNAGVSDIIARYRDSDDSAANS